MDKSKRIQHIEAKKENFRIKVTTYIQGDLKNKFTNDCIYRGVTEADMARDIFDVFYSTIKCNPCLLGKSMFEIKEYIKNQHKL